LAVALQDLAEEVDLPIRIEQSFAAGQPSAGGVCDDKDFDQPRKETAR
jgi:hypothetical protein